MNATDMRAMETEELQSRVTEWEEKLFRHYCEKKIGQLDNPNVLREVRRDIARAKTIIVEKDHAASQPSQD